jgi:hypothetical protein
MPMGNIKQVHSNTLSPLVSKTLPTMSANTAVTTKMNNLIFLTTRTVIHAIPIPITLANEHLLNLSHLNTTNLTAMPQLEDTPVTIVQEDAIDSYWLANN